MPTGVRDTLCDVVLGMPQEKVRVVGRRRRRRLRHEDRPLSRGHRRRLRRALQLKRPVKWRAERIEEFLAATHGRDVESRAELALDADGKVLALRIRIARQRRRLCHHRRRHHPADGRPVGHDQHLRHRARSTSHLARC